MFTHLRSITALALVLISAVTPATAAPGSRTVTVPYDGPNTVMLEAVTDGARLFTVQTDKASPSPGAAYVAVRIEDSSGQPVAAAVHQGQTDLGTVCGNGDEHLQLASAKPIHLHLQFGVSVECGGPTVPTQGTVELEFHK